MRTQSATSGVNARGTYADFTQYDQKLKPSPLVPRRPQKKELRKEAAMNEAFMRGFFDELEKVAVAPVVAATAGRGLLGRAASSLGSSIKGDPTGSAMAAMQAASMAKGMRGGDGGVPSPVKKRKTGLMAGLGFSGAV